FFFSSRRRHTMFSRDWSSDVCSSDLGNEYAAFRNEGTHNGNLLVNWQQNGWQVQASGSRNNFGGWQGNSEGRALDWNPKDQWLRSEERRVGKEAGARRTTCQCDQRRS